MPAQCPHCGSGSMQRVKRRLVTRLLWPTSKKYTCRDCGSESLHKPDQKAEPQPRSR